MADVFLSYVREDRDVAERVAKALEAAGLSVWWDRHLRAGVEFAAEIEREIAAARVVLVLWSSQSIHSGWVRDEAAYARDAGKLIPVRLNGTEAPFGFRQIQAIELATPLDADGAARVADVVAALRHDAPETAASTAAQVMPTSSDPRRARGRLRAGVLLALALALVAAAVFRYVARDPIDRGRFEIAAFEPLSKDASLVAFATALGSAVERVLATNEVRTVAHDEPGATRAEFVIGGRVALQDGQFVAEADVRERGEGITVWSMRVARDAAQGATLQEQLAVSVADVVRCAFRLRDQLEGTTTTEMHSQFFRFCELQRTGSLAQLPELARRAIESAPGEAVGYAMCAGANGLATMMADVTEQERARLRAVSRDCAAKALAIDDRYAAVYASLAMIDDPALSLAERERLLRKSFDLDPGFIRARGWYASLLWRVGRLREARTYYRRVIDDYPLSPPQDHIELAMLEAAAGDVDGARRIFEDVGRTWPEPWLQRDRVLFEYYHGDPKLAVGLAEGVRLPQRVRACIDAFLSVQSGARGLDEVDLDRLCGGLFRVLQLARMGEVDAAFEGLEAAIEDLRRGRYTVWLWVDVMRDVRADRRFMALASRIGLVDYWLDTDQWPDFCSADALSYDCKTAALEAHAPVDL